MGDSYKTRDHGGGLDAAVARYGGTREDWLDLSTGVNPDPYPIPKFSSDAWTALPDQAAFERLERSARDFWNVPQTAGCVIANGASSLIARMPELHPGRAYIPAPTYNEHAAAFARMGRAEVTNPDAPIKIVVHPNNPDGRIWSRDELAHGALIVVDESFCDVSPELSLINMSDEPNTLVLKSFGKFWGLAGLRLGFAFGDPTLCAALQESLGPWAVSGPALELGADALSNKRWAAETRAKLANSADKMDALLTKKGASLVGGTSLFRLYDVGDANAWKKRLAQGRVWSRSFPYSKTWLRLGLPPEDRWSQLESAL